MWSSLNILNWQLGIKGNRGPKNGEVLWTDGDDDGIVYSGTVTLHNQGGRNRPPPSYDTVDSYHQDRSMYGDDLVYDEAVFAARDSTLDRSRAEPGRRLHAERQATAPRSGKVQGRASICLSALYPLSVTLLSSLQNYFLDLHKNAFIASLSKSQG